MRSRLALSIWLLGLAACSRGTPPPAPDPFPRRTLSATVTHISPSPSPATATASAVPTMTPPPTSASCQRQGRLVENTVPEDGFGRELPYHLYLPPCADPEDRALPTVILLHGLARDYDQWLTLGVAQAADELILSGDIPPIAIVLPWERTGVELEPALLDGLLPHVAQNYPVTDDGRSRALGGISRGAGWAFRIGFRHRDDFSALGLHSPALFGGDLFAVERWLEREGGGAPPRVWVDIGDRDNLVEAAEDLSARLDELGIPHEYRMDAGRHEAAYWQAHMQDYLRWYAQEWSTQPETN